MTDFNVRSNRVAMTVPELAALEQLVKSGDRAGFYLAYYGMTDSAEALTKRRSGVRVDLIGTVHPLNDCGEIHASTRP
jgi:hypothetical protein